jgi:hypothetical protein
MQKLYVKGNIQIPDIYTNIKNPPGQKFLSRKRVNVQGKKDVW